MAYYSDSSQDYFTRLQIASLVFLMANAVLFGIGAIAVLSIPALSAQAAILLPVVIALSVLVAAPASWIIAPRLRARYWRRRETGSVNRPYRVDELREQIRIS